MQKNRENDRARLQHMLHNARLARQFAQGKSREELETDDRTRLALDRAIEIIGEAASHITEEFQNETPAIPWNEIKGTRLIIAHKYYEIDHDVLWDTVQNHLPQLIEQLDEILSCKDQPA